MNRDLKKLFNSVEIMALSTSSNDSVPNVVAIASKLILDDNTLLTIDTFHKKTKDNIIQNGKVAIALWKGKEGFQIQGKAKYHSSGDIFEAGKQWILQSKPNKIVKGVIEIKITAIFSINPNYEEAGKKIS